MLQLDSYCLVCLLLSVVFVFHFAVSAWSFISSSLPQQGLSTLKNFHPRFYPLLSLSYINSWDRASIYLFNFDMKRALTGDWTRTSCTWCQHSTTMLSSRHLWHLKLSIRTRYTGMLRNLWEESFMVKAFLTFCAWYIGRMTITWIESPWCSSNC